MQAPIEIASRGIELPEHLQETIREHANNLDSLFDKITSCHVTLETQDHDHHQKGRFYNVHIALNVPGAQLVVNRNPEADFYRAVHEAFHAMRRELEDYVCKQRGQVKVHEELPRGTILRLFPEDDYGFIVSNDGKEVYFHRNSVIDADFDELSHGSVVSFVEELGEKGPQASTVRAI